MEHLDLFSGIGGFAYAVKIMGWRTVAFCEKDEFCQKVLRKNFNNEIPIYEDITQFTGESIPNADIITAGFPCQDVSIAGNRAGFDGERTSLWFEALRLIEYFQPQWVLLENVVGLLSSRNGRDFAAIVQGLEDCGYGVAWRTFDAQYFGVAGTRRRVFIVGSLGTNAAGTVLFDGKQIGELLPQRKTERSIKPMCVGWDGGLSLERLRQCVITQADTDRAGTGNGLSCRLDKFRYRALGNAVVPSVVLHILKNIEKQGD